MWLRIGLLIHFWAIDVVYILFLQLTTQMHCLFIYFSNFFYAEVLMSLVFADKQGTCWSWQKRSDEEVAKIYIWWGENFGGEKLFLHLQSFKLFIMCVCMFVNVFSFESKVFLVTNKGLVMVGCHKTNKKYIMVRMYK